MCKLYSFLSFYLAIKKNVQIHDLPVHNKTLPIANYILKIKKFIFQRYKLFCQDVFQCVLANFVYAIDQTTKVLKQNCIF